MDKITVSTPITVKKLAEKMSVGANKLIKQLMDLGEMVTITSTLNDEDTITLLAHEFNYDVVFGEENIAPEVPEKEEVTPKKKETPKKTKKKTKKSTSKESVTRAPVVTFMGHVDHGKTSLLDFIRESRITAKESGGITQHIGAYVVDTDHGRVAFLDTPGHEAFTEMRARGANVTDIVVLVIAADDGIMPQTKEAIDHCKAAGVPIIVAINKVDLASANVDNVKKQLAERELTPEDWGGDIICCELSAKEGTGFDHLLEMILLQSEMLELTAEPEGPLEAFIVESQLCQGKGPTATVLVKDGTLRIGDTIVAGTVYAKIKSMIDEHGKPVKEAGPSTPVEILGFNEVPLVGTELNTSLNEKAARDVVQKLKNVREQAEGGIEEVTLEDIYARIAEGQMKSLNLILKADTMGSIEAIRGSIDSITSDEVNIKLLLESTGDISDNDVMLASASQAIIIGFHVKLNQKVRDLAKREGVDIRLYSVIYSLIDEIERSVEGMLDPKMTEVITGHARVKQIFNITKIGNIAGCVVEDGRINNKSKVRVLRNDDIVFEGDISILKRFKDEVKEVRVGQECGICIKSFENLEDEDLIEAYDLVTEKKKI